MVLRVALLFGLLGPPAVKAAAGEQCQETEGAALLQIRSAPQGVEAELASIEANVQRMRQQIELEGIESSLAHLHKRIRQVGMKGSVQPAVQSELVGMEPSQPSQPPMQLAIQPDPLHAKLPIQLTSVGDIKKMAIADTEISRASLMQSQTNPLQNWTKAQALLMRTGAHPDRAKTPPKVFIGFSSGPAYFHNRMHWRQKGCGKELLDANITYAFVIGVPTDPGSALTAHDGGVKASESEVHLSKLLLEESMKYGDIVFLPMYDTYLSLKDKTLSIIQHGYHRVGAKYIMEADDDVCINTGEMLASIAEHESQHPTSELYAGKYMWQGNEYPQMMSWDGSSAPYFTGLGSLMSRGLAKLIVSDDRAHSILFGPYGTTDEDVQTGKWVKFAKEQHGIDVEYKMISGLLRNASNDGLLVT